jgi:hypothetical protein
MSYLHLLGMRRGSGANFAGIGIGKGKSLQEIYAARTVCAYFSENSPLRCSSDNPGFHTAALEGSEWFPLIEI